MNDGFNLIFDMFEESLARFRGDKWEAFFCEPTPRSKYVEAIKILL